MKFRWKPILALPLLIVLIGFWLLWPHGKPTAGWYDDNFQYRKKITVTNNTSTETNKYVTLSSFDTSNLSRFQTDCGDIRFVKANGEILPYYIVSGCGSASTSFHINFDTLAAGAQDIYIYYGNAWASNGFQTVDFSSAATNVSVGTPATEEGSTAPIAYWKFDEGSDNTCFGGRNDLCDTMQERTDLAASGVTRQSADQCLDGNCLSFDGTNDFAMVNTKSDLNFAASDSFTVSGWFRHAPKTSGTDVLLSKQQTTLGTGSTATTTITTSTVEGIGGYDASWLNRVVYDPNNKRWHVIYIDSNADIFDRSTAATSGVTFDGSGAIAAGTYEYEDYGCSVDTDGPSTYLHCTYSTVSTDQLFYTRCSLTGSAPYITCDAQQEVYESSDVGKSNNDDIQFPRIATDMYGCSMIIADYQDSTEAAGDQHEVWLWKEAAPCGDGTWTSQTGFPMEDIATAGGFNADMGVGIKSFGNLDFQLFWIDTDGGTASSDLETNFFYGETNRLGTEQELETAVEYAANNEGYNSVVFNTRNISFAADEGTNDLDAYVVNTLNGSLSTQVDTIVNVAAQAAQYDGYVSAAVDTVDAGADKVYVFGMNNSDNTDIYYNYSSDGGTTWNGSATLWVNSFDANEVKYFSSAFNYQNCDLMHAWIGSFGTVNVDTKIINTGSCTTSANTGYKLQMESDGDLTFSVSDGSNSDSATTTEATYDDNEWHHFDAVKNGTTSLKLYIDGKQVASDTSIAATGTLSNSNDFYLGIDSDRSSNPYGGFLDTVKVYRYARSDAQILADSARPPLAAPKGNAAILGQGSNDFLTEGLVGYWKMDEASWNGTTNEVVDSSGNSHHGISVNGATTTSTSKFSYAGNFDGTDDEVTVTNSADFYSSGDFSVATWVKLDTLPTVMAQDGSLISKPGLSNLSYLLYVSSSSNKPIMRWTNTDQTHFFASCNSALTTGTWYHVVGVKEGSILRVYCNGIAEGITNLTGTMYDGSGAGPLRFGSQNGGSRLDGQMDDTRFYNRALSPSEVTALYKWAPGPVGYWKLDENTGATTIYDASGNNLTGTINGNMSQSSWTQGKFGSALMFDGSDDYIDITDNGKLSPTSALSISTWVKFNQLSSTKGESQRIVRKVCAGAVCANNSSYILEYHNTTNNIRFSVHLGGSLIYVKTADNSIVPNTWYYLTAVYDSATSNIKIYINGVDQTAFQSGAASGAIQVDTSALLLGAHSSSASRVDGAIDDVRIYNYARTQAQIIEDMNASHPIGGSPVGSQVGYWKFDEGALNTCANGTDDFCDSSINANDLAFSGTAGGITLSGKFNKAFDGNAARWASRADDDDFDFAAADDFTLTAWIKSDGTASGTQYILNKSSATSQGYGIYGSSSGKVVFAIDDDTSWTPDDQAQSTTNVFDQTWHYIAARKTGTSKIDLFIDGRLEGSDTSLGATGSLSNAVAFYVGDRDGTDNGDEFNGDVDEVKIYRGALTDDQIKLDYNRGSSIILGSTSTASDGVTVDNSQSREFCVPGDTATCNPPVGWWRLDEGTGSTTYDNSSNLLNGTITSAGWIPGVKGNALAVGTGKYVTVSDNSLIKPTSAITVETWFRSTDITTSQRIISKKNTTGFRLALSTSTCTSSSALCFLLRIAGVDQSVVYSRTNLSNNTWYHAAGTYDGANMKLYVNGVLVSTVPMTGTIQQGTQPLCFGAESASSDCTGGSALLGDIDNVMIYDYARSAAQIAWDYNHGGPIAHYKLDECSGTTAYNSVLNGNGLAAGLNGTISIGATGSNTAPGTCTGAATEAWKNGANGKINSSLSFDGTDDYISVADPGTNSILDLSSVGSHSFWVKFNSLPIDEAFFVTKGDASKNNYYSALCTTASCGTPNSLICGVYNGVSGDELTYLFTPTLGRWYHIACTYDDPNNTINLFLDGKLMSSKTDATSDFSSAVNNGELRIGRERDVYGYYFNGQIDDVRIFSYALSPAQVKTIMNNSSSVNFAPITGSP